MYGKEETDSVFSLLYICTLCSHSSEIMVPKMTVVRAIK